MTRATVTRIARRVAVLMATGAVIAVGVVTVQLASQWRAEAAPLDTAPVSMQSISDAAAAEADRADQLSGQVDDVARSLGDLKAALMTAEGSMTGDAEQATALKQSIADSNAKLVTLQGQLAAAQARLTELNKAAARQAALNKRATTTTTRTTTSSGGGEVEHDD